MNEYEYAIPMKKNKNLTMKKAGLLSLYAAIVIGWFVFGFATNLFPLLCFIPLSLWIVIHFTWRYVNIELGYTLQSGNMSAAVIYGGRVKKTQVEFAIKDVSLIAPVSSHGYKADDYEPEAKYDILSSPDSPDSYFAIFEKDGKRSVLYFEATEKALKILKYYNSAATVVAKTTH